jgi:hypothetical protein
VAGAITWRYLNVAPLTLHFSGDPDHRNVYMLGIERQAPMATSSAPPGFAIRSAAQRIRLCGGRRFERLYGHDPLYLQLTGGLLYGYLPPYDHKVPLNYRGFSPGAGGGARLAPFALTSRPRSICWATPP